MVDLYAYRTPPYAHQRAAFEATRALPYYALFWEQRVGKTKVVVDTAAWRYELPRDDPRHVDALVVVAYPAAVHRNWVSDEVPAHLPERVPRRTVCWRSGKMTGAAAKRELEELLATPALAILALNCEAILTATAWHYLRRFFARRRVLLVADESWLRSPGARRTKRALAMARHPNAVARRILDGTPCAEGPFDLYAPTNFLKPGLLGFTSFAAFKAHHGEFEQVTLRSGASFPKLLRYRHEAELTEKLRAFSSRLTRAECADLPPKVYAKRYFALTQAQRLVYDQLRSTYRAELGEGVEVEALHVLTRYQRLATVARGYWPAETSAALCAACLGEGCGACGQIGYAETSLPARPIDGEFPALEVLKDELARCETPALVWCQFQQDVADCVAALTAAGRRVGRYDGTVRAPDRQAVQRAFQSDELDVVVATPDTAGRGLNWSRAGLLVYYSQGYSLRLRGQSEDRAESLASALGRGPTQIVDIVAEDTVDVVKIDALRAKQSLSDLLLGDRRREWL